jgi:hypothetical protein
MAEKIEKTFSDASDAYKSALDAAGRAIADKSSVLMNPGESEWEKFWASIVIGCCERAREAK